MGSEEQAADGGQRSLSTRSSVHVLATTAEGTRAALLAAKRLTRGLDVRVVVLVPRLQSSFDTFDPTTNERAQLLDAQRQLAADVGIHVAPLFCVCHRLEDVVHQMLGPSSLVLVGGRHNAIWPTREERLVSRLTREGYLVVFARVGAEPRPALVPIGSS